MEPLYKKLCAPLAFTFFLLSQAPFAFAENAKPTEVISQEREREKQRQMIQRQMSFLAGSLGSMPTVPELDKKIQLPFNLEEDDFDEDTWDF